jgi:hypothetical protein
MVYCKSKLQSIRDAVSLVSDHGMCQANYCLIRLYYSLIETYYYQK